jgi:hypothetical protein
MKALAPLAIILSSGSIAGLISGCVAEPQTESSSSDLSLTNLPGVNLFPTVGPDASESQAWVAGRMGVDTLWPTGVGIVTMQALMRKGPDINCAVADTGASTCQHTFVAFVVWNHATVGKIFWIPEGPTGADFKQNLDLTFAQRTNPYQFRWAGGTGGGGAGTPPTPHPNVAGDIVVSFSPTYLGVVKTAAGQIDGADIAFTQYAE